MLEEMRVLFYRVERCGYYAYGEQNPRFGCMGKLLAEIESWSVGKEIGQTKISEPSRDGDRMPPYLSDIQQKQGTFLICLWNEVPAGADGHVASLPSRAAVGMAKQVNNEIEPNTIPGYPTYFWLAPQRNVLATLRFHSALTGQPNLQEYLEQFLTTQASHAIRVPVTPDTTSITVWGYRMSDKHTPTTDVTPRFRTRVATKPGQIDMLRARVADINKVHRRAVLSLHDSTERSLWQEALRLMGLSTRDDGRKQARLAVSMAKSVTEEELENLIEEWEDNQGNQWDDCGFQLRGETDKHWLSSARVAGEFTLNVERGDNDQIDTKKLLDQIVKIKGKMLELLP